MPEPMFSLSVADVELLRQIVYEHRQFNNLLKNPGKIEHEEHQAPEVYIALTPFDGIPGLVVGTTDTGTSLHSFEDDVPGSAFCEVYQVADDGVSPKLVHVDGIKPRVYNLCTEPIGQYKWIVVDRDKFGRWLVVKYCANWVTGTGGSGGPVAIYGRANSGAVFGPEGTIHLIPGTGLDITGVDDPGEGELEFTLKGGIQIEQDDVGTSSVSFGPFTRRTGYLDFESDDGSITIRVVERSNGKVQVFFKTASGASGFSGSSVVVTSVTCVAGNLVVGTQTWVFNNGLRTT